MARVQLVRSNVLLRELVTFVAVVVVSAVLGLGLGTAVALAFVSAPVQAWGVVATVGAPQPLTADVSGRVASVLVSPGDEVAANVGVLQIQAVGLESDAEGRRRELESLRSELSAASQEDQAATSRSLAVLQRRRELIAQRLELKETEIAQRKRLLDDITGEVRAGSTPEAVMVEASATTRAASEARLGLVDALAQLDLEVSDRRSAAQQREAERRARLADAEARLRRAQDALRMTVVRAPSAGFIEALRVAPGSLVQAGSELARLVPRTPPRTIVALVRLNEVAHVQPGAEARVELTALPRDTGLLPARVQHVSREVAAPGRVHDILGSIPEDSFVEVDLELADSAEYRAIEPTLRSGSRAIVSLVTPDRRLGRALLDRVLEWHPFRSWG
jgi:multidrug resistance efflux pump